MTLDRDPRLNDRRFLWRFETANAGPPSAIAEANVSGAIVLRDGSGKYMSVTSAGRLKFQATQEDRSVFLVERTSEDKIVLKGKPYISLI